MLPIFRMISVGGVFLAITTLALALTPAGVSPARFAAVDPPARGALIDRAQHPEWRQFIIQAAMRRVDELSRLRELPDSATRLPQIPNVTPSYVPPIFPNLSSGETSQTAGLPAQDGDDADDATGAIGSAPSTIPIEIGEKSSTELPAISSDEKPPAIRVPLSGIERQSIGEPSPLKATRPTDPHHAPRKKSAARHRKAPAQAMAPAEKAETAPAQFNLLQAIFGSPADRPAADKASAAAKPRVRAKAAKSQHAAAQ